jgi:hypothetical protein
LSLAALLAVLPALYWAQPVATAPVLREAGIEHVLVPPDRMAAWRQAGLDAAALGTREREKLVPLPPPGIVARADQASASRRPWIDANGWRYLRRPRDRYLCETGAGQGVLAAAEAFAYGADAVLTVDASELPALGRALAFFRGLPEAPLPGIADLAVVDDGSPLSGELMNLLARRNLLFRVAPRAVPELPFTVKLGTKEYPKSAAVDPDALALQIRRKLTDERRSLRLFGSEVVLARLTGDASRLRLHLLNYGGRTIEGLRVRLRGSWTPAEAHVLDSGPLAVEDLLVAGGATEFSLPALGPYGVVDLTAAR